MIARTFLYLVALPAVALAQQPTAVATTLTPQHVMRMRHVVSAEPSPDGAHILFVSRRMPAPDRPPGGSVLEAFVIPTDGGSVARVPSASRVAWHPDGRVCYVAKRDGDEAPQLYAVPLTNGTETRLTDAPNGIGSYAFRPDGEAVAYTALDPLPPARAANQERGFRPEVVDEDYRHVSLWLFDMASGESTRLTQGLTVQSFVWSPDGSRLAVGMSPRNLVDDSYMFTRIYEVVPGESSVRKLVTNPGKLAGGAWSPDGRHLAFISAADKRDPHAGLLYVVDRESREVAAITPGLRGMVEHVHWHDGATLECVVARGVRTFLEHFPVEGAEFVDSFPDAVPTRVDDGPSGDAIALPATSAVEPIANTGRYVMAASTRSHPAEVFVTDARGRARRLTDSNPWLDGVELGAQEVRLFEARDGTPIEGILMLPPNRGDADARLPLVIVAHGGPESHYADGWLTRYSEPGQVLAGMGYAVWYPNYRASTGYGVDFAKADHGDPMGREFEDHLDAIAAFAADGLVDAERVGVIGGSYGGYTAAWAATRHSEHFKAAVSFVPFVDIRTKWLTSDIPFEFYFVHYQERWPHEQTGFLADRSPLTWAPHCRTPLLLCGGDSDTRVHPSQPFMLYRAVKTATATPCRYVRYPGEGHGNRVSTNRYDYLLRSIRWLDHYLQPGVDRMASPPPIDLEYPAWD